MTSENQTLTIFTDGAARGNPGPAAAAFVVSRGEEIILQQALPLGDQTNNTAEYLAVITALNWALGLINSSLTISSQLVAMNFYLDSQLVVEQLKGNYKVKQPHLKSFHTYITHQLRQLQSRGVHITFSHVPRTQNNLADGLANQALDLMTQTS